jgi:Uncharacterized protein conserved in bacteria
MKYMLLIYGAEPSEPPTEQAIQEVMDQYWAYEKAVADAGVRLGGDALQGRETATTVQVSDSGERLVTDGPFAETREVLGGYYLIDVPDLDAALDWAARCPGSRSGGKVEVRPIMEVRGAVTAARAAGSVEAVFREERGRCSPRSYASSATWTSPRRSPPTRSPPRWSTAGRRVPRGPPRGVLTTARREGRRPVAARQGLRGAARVDAGRGRAVRARRGGG